MSSAKSPALNPADLHDALQTALIEVSENAYFVFVEPADHVQFADAVGLVKDAWLKVSVAFEGSFAGAVEIVMPEPLGMWLVTSLLGMQGHETLEEVAQFDGVGEFANMVCGAWLSKANETASFTLDMPKVKRMPAEWAPGATPQGAEQAYRTVVVNELPLEVRAR
jgi:hypothetical protein